MKRRFVLRAQIILMILTSVLVIWPGRVMAYSLNVNFTGNGKGTVTDLYTGLTFSSSFTEAINTPNPITLAATARGGSHVVYWDGCDSYPGVNGCGLLGRFDNRTVSVWFQLNQYTVSSYSNGNGTISPGSATVNYGGSITFSIAPSQGYQLSNLTDNGSNVTAGGNTYTISGVNSNHTVVASFAANPPPPIPSQSPAFSTPSFFLLAALALIAVALWKARRRASGQTKG